MKRAVLVMAVAAAALVIPAASASAARLANCLPFYAGHPILNDCVFLIWWENSPPTWAVPTVTATRNESVKLARQWHTHTASFQMQGHGLMTDGIPIFVGRPKALDQMACTTLGAPCSQYLVSHCFWGNHSYQPANGLAWVEMLTYGPKKCYQHDNKDLLKTLTVTFAHEVLETLVNGDNQARVKILGQWIDEEVVDPVHNFAYYDKADGVWLPDFTYPSFWRGGKPPYDLMGKVHHSASYYVRRGSWPG
jgi:hypothetical protein